MQSFDLQGQVHVQIFTYKDVSVFNVSPNFPMFYDTSMFPRKYFDSMSCSHTQVHTLKDVSSHTFVLWRCVRVQCDT